MKHKTISLILALFCILHSGVSSTIKFHEDISLNSHLFEPEEEMLYDRPSKTNRRGPKASKFTRDHLVDLESYNLLEDHQEPCYGAKNGNNWNVGPDNHFLNNIPGCHEENWEEHDFGPGRSIGDVVKTKWNRNHWKALNDCWDDGLTILKPKEIEPKPFRRLKGLCKGKHPGWARLKGDDSGCACGGTLRDPLRPKRRDTYKSPRPLNNELYGENEALTQSESNNKAKPKAAKSVKKQEKAEPSQQKQKTKPHKTKKVPAKKSQKAHKKVSKTNQKPKVKQVNKKSKSK